MSAGLRPRLRIRAARCLAALLCAAALLGTTVLAQSAGGDFELRASAVASGGGRAQGGSHVLEGTLGQHDAGTLQSGGAFQLTGGLHRRAPPEPGGALLADSFEGP